MMHLLDLLFPPRADERAIRDVSVDDFVSRVSPTIVDYTRPGTVALLSFADRVVRSALHEAKYHGSAHAFRLLGAALEAYLTDADEIAKRAVLVPVPLGKERFGARGYNQVEQVFRHASLEWSTDPNLLVRTRETSTQVGLSREKRDQNLQGAFAAPRPLDPAYTYIVVDDVITTGATLQAAVDALTTAGATHILPVALAH